MAINVELAVVVVLWMPGYEFIGGLLEETVEHAHRPIAQDAVGLQGLTVDAFVSIGEIDKGVIRLLAEMAIDSELGQQVGGGLANVLALVRKPCCKGLIASLVLASLALNLSSI
jgi:hypothetical protein